MNLNSEDPTIAAQLEAGNDLDLDAVVEELLIELKQECKGAPFHSQVAV